MCDKASRTVLGAGREDRRESWDPGPTASPTREGVAAPLGLPAPPIRVAQAFAGASSLAATWPASPRPLFEGPGVLGSGGGAPASSEFFQRKTGRRRDRREIPRVNLPSALRESRTSEDRDPTGFRSPLALAPFLGTGVSVCRSVFSASLRSVSGSNYWQGWQRRALLGALLTHVRTCSHRRSPTRPSRGPGSLGAAVPLSSLAAAAQTPLALLALTLPRSLDPNCNQYSLTVLGRSFASSPSTRHTRIHRIRDFLSRTFLKGQDVKPRKSLFLQGFPIWASNEYFFPVIVKGRKEVCLECRKKEKVGMNSTTAISPQFPNSVPFRQLKPSNSARKEPVPLGSFRKGSFGDGR